MSDFTLTADQVRVVHDCHPNLSVRASAGAGKTRVLAAKYVWHIENGLAPDQILTITFTRKAAAEMKKRIVTLLRERGLEEAAQGAETGPIQTIHGFCERLLRENSLAAGIDPRFEILPEGAPTRQVFELAVRRALAELCEGSDLVRGLMLQLASTREFGAPEGLLGRTSMEVHQVLNKLRGCGLTPEEILPLFESAGAYQQAMVQLLRADLGEVSAPETGLAVPAIVRQWQGELKEVGIRMPRWLRAASEEAERKAIDFALGLGQLAIGTWLHLSSELERRQSFDFAELETRAVRLVEDHPEARERLQRQYRVVMVDEAQDVNPMQYRLLAGLGVGVELMVGDPQQSIYAFRQADRELFVRRTEQGETRNLQANHRSDPGILRFVDRLFGQLWGEYYMPMAAASAPVSDDPFESNEDYTGVEFWPQDQADPALTAYWLQELLTEAEFRPKDVAILVRTSKAAAEIAPHLDRLGIEYKIVGGADSFYTRMEVRDLANALQALSDPYDDFALLALLRSPIVGISLDSVVLLATRKPVCETLGLGEVAPEVPFEAPAEEDAAKLDAFRDWFCPLSQFADRLPAWELLSRILAKTHYLENLAERADGRQVIANVRKLLDLATQEPELGAVRYAEQIREIQRVRHREGNAPAVDDDADVVTLMTIHKAKGLEFKCVILPEMHAEQKRSRDRVLIDPETGLIAVRYGSEQPILHRLLEDRARERALDEEQRVLYVAMTRAEKRLCLCIGEGSKNPTHSHTIASRFPFRENTPPGLRVRSLPGRKDASL